MSKVKKRCREGQECAKRDVLEILNSNVRCSKLISLESRDFLTICHSDMDADRMFTDECLLALDAIGCVPVMPPILKTKRSVIVRRLDPLIYDNTPPDIINGLLQRNEWLKVEDVHKFPNSKTMKLICKTQDAVRRCMLDGIRLFNLYVSPEDMQVEDYYEIMVCYRFFALNDHPTGGCPKGRDYVVCSSCSQVGHNFKDCPETGPKHCMNCGGAHSAVAYSCPHRRSIIQTLKERTSTRNPVSPEKNHLLCCCFRNDCRLDGCHK